MFFNTIQYLLFLPVTLILFYLTKDRYRWIILFSASCFFYMYFIPKYILCLFFLILVDFFAARAISVTDDSKKRKLLLWLSVISNFGLLFYFKYLNFFTESLNAITIPLFDHEFSLSDGILPIGLSFHTFQSVSYVIDVYKKKIQPENHLGLYSCYVLFFPQMVAGPIERYSTLGQELKKNTRFSFGFLKAALPLLLTGFFYKMVIADNCGEYVNSAYRNLEQQNSFTVLTAVFMFCIQIYCDFFGYSLIAQGSAKLFGIKLVDNFSFPFFSTNIIDFWKKWHLSLTGWFRDYVYFPLGGSRKTVTIHYLNVLIVFALSGLWHGAGMNFIIWGLLHGMVYVTSLFLFKKFKWSLPVLLNYLLTFTVVSFIFVFFRSGNFTETQAIFRSAFFNSGISLFHIPPVHLIINLLLLLFLESRVRHQSNYQTWYTNNRPVWNNLIYSWLLLSLLTFSGTDNIPFIYFQF